MFFVSLDVYFYIIFGCLFNDSFFEVLSEVGADFRGGTFGGHLGDVVLHHQLHQLLKTCLCGIPSQFGLGLGRVAPKVDHIGRAIEVLTDGNQCLADEFFGTFHTNAPLFNALALKLEFDARKPQGLQKNPGPRRPFGTCARVGYVSYPGIRIQ